MLTFDLPMLTFDLPKRSVLQKEANLGRSKVTTFHGRWWPLTYLGLRSAETSVFCPHKICKFWPQAAPKKPQKHENVEQPFSWFWSLFFCFVADVSLFVLFILLLFPFFCSSFVLFLFCSQSSFFCFFDLEAKEKRRQRQRKKVKTKIMEKKERKERKEGMKERKEWKKGKTRRKERKEKNEEIKGRK